MPARPGCVANFNGPGERRHRAATPISAREAIRDGVRRSDDPGPRANGGGARPTGGLHPAPRPGRRSSAGPAQPKPSDRDRRRPATKAARAAHPGAGPSSTTSWAHEKPQRHPGPRQQPGPGRRGDVLVVIVAVFLAYNANNGLPFVSTYDLGRGAERQRAGQRQRGADRRRPGRRSSRRSTPVQDETTARSPPKLDLRLDKSVEPLPVDSTMIVRPKSALGLKFLRSPRATPTEGLPQGGDAPARRRAPGTGRHRPVLRHVRRADAAARSSRTRPGSATPSPAAARS